MFLQPADDEFELGLEGAGVEEVAGSVAVVEGSVDLVDLALDCEYVSMGGRICRDYFDIRMRIPSFS